MGLKDIDIQVLGGLDSLSQGDNARALLHEIAKLLKELLKTDQPSSIDLRRLPMTQEDFELLKDVLGVGEVSAEVINLGPTQVWETGIAGVWWVTHYNEEEEIISEFIEVTYCPEILITPVEDVRDAFEALTAKLLAAEFKHRKGGTTWGE